MDTISFIIIFFLLAGCKPSVNYYQGYIFDEDKRPIPNATISLKSDEDKYYVQSDSLGYFKMVITPFYYDHLIIEKIGYKTDTVKTVWMQSGEKLRYCFLNTTNDTLFLQKK